MAKLVPAGWRLVFVIHYVSTGVAQTDQTSLGLVFARPETVRQEVATKLLQEINFVIPPRVADYQLEKSWQADKDVLILAFFPHMHLRGKSFRYEALYPDGTKEILLDVPRYDFNWQNRYVLAEPKRLPAGSQIHCLAHYDNSADNPINPDPDATVHEGTQTWDEMFNGYFEVALADQDLIHPAWTDVLQKALQKFFTLPVWAAFAALLLSFLVYRRCAKWPRPICRPDSQAADPGNGTAAP
jgi:hypothetical protein